MDAKGPKIKALVKMLEKKALLQILINQRLTCVVKELLGRSKNLFFGAWAQLFCA
jgi:hypothetical protein